MAPLSGVVYVYNVEGVHLASANLDATGGYIQYLDPGTYFLRVTTAPGYVPELHNNIACVAIDCLVTSGTPVVLSAPGQAATVDFALATEGKFTGTVRNAGGAVVPGVQVDVYNASTSVVTTVTTASDGTYVVGGLPAGTYLARAATKLYAGLPCPTSDCRIASGTPITVITGATTAGIDFSFDAAPLSAALSGTVLQDGSMTPLGGVPVRAYAGDLLVASGTTNALGHVHGDGTARCLPGSNGGRAGKFRRRVARRPMYRVCRHIAGCRGWSRRRHQWARFLACARRRDFRADCVCGYRGGFYSASGDQRVQQRRRASSAWGVAIRRLHTHGRGLPD